jgi:alkanesulfonate monooxygenase SsuD/methylene tetrahydromethanopterin reductase-like flavin-dependent oxidoreductase (luciferase family)
VSIALRPTVRVIIDRYCAERARLGKTHSPFMGVARHVVVADTDEAALKIARRAYPRWRGNFRWLFARHGTEPRIAALYPPTFDHLAAIDNGVAGSPKTVRDFIAAEIEATGSNYFVSWLAFGDMTLGESLRSLELFSREVMPAFVSARADAAQ